MGSLDLVKNMVKGAFSNLSNLTRQSQKIKELTVERSELLRRLTENNKIIMSLKTALENNGEIVSENCAYWRKDGLGNIVEGPFCKSCFITESAFRPLVRVVKPGRQNKDDWEWVQCSKCRFPFRQKQVGEYLKNRKALKTSKALI
jgi:hypothetical protein